jgi:hypothetical protein
MVFDKRFIRPGEKINRRCNLTFKLQKLVNAGVIKAGQLTDIIADHDQDNCALFHNDSMCTCDPEIHDIKGNRLA